MSEEPNKSPPETLLFRSLQKNTAIITTIQQGKFGVLQLHYCAFIFFVWRLNVQTKPRRLPLTFDVKSHGFVVPHRWFKRTVEPVVFVLFDFWAGKQNLSRLNGSLEIAGLLGGRESTTNSVHVMLVVKCAGFRLPFSGWLFLQYYILFSIYIYTNCKNQNWRATNTFALVSEICISAA